MGVSVKGVEVFEKQEDVIMCNCYKCNQEAIVEIELQVTRTQTNKMYLCDEHARELRSGIEEQLDEDIEQLLKDKAEKIAKSLSANIKR